METNSEFKIISESDNQDETNTQSENINQNEVETAAIANMQYKMYLKRENIEHSEHTQNTFLDAWNTCSLYMKEVLKYALLEGMGNDSNDS